MATILSGDIGVEYLAANRQKRLYWIGGTNTEYTMNEIYSAMATLLDETTTIDDGTCMSAETPTEYTIGNIDTGDTEPWYITHDLMEKIQGGALRTTGWTNAVGTNAGIWAVPVASGGSIVAADEGFDMTHGDGDVGTLVEFIDTGDATDYLMIRPDTSGAANDFSTSAGTITSSRGAFTATQNGPGTTGEQIWTNLYSLGTIDANVHLYAYQGLASLDGDRVRMRSWNDNTQDWYGNGHIDRCFAMNDVATAAWPVIDSGYITILARKSGDLYASFEVAASTTSGGRNPIPLQTATDLDQTTGIKQVTTGAHTGTYVVGEIITEGVSGARGIVTSLVDGVSIDFMPIDDPKILFFSSGAQTVTGATSAATSTSSGQSDQGPALSTWFTSNATPTISFTHTNADIDDDSVDENYGIVIDCNANPLTEVYEWVKYATRNGETTNDLDGINGESYVGGEVYLAWSGTITGSMLEGGDVTQANTLATGVIVSIDATDKVALLRDVRGTFNTTDIVTDNDNSGTVTPNTAAETFAAKTASPLGTFAGGTFFGARGVLLSDYLAADANSFILTPIEGGTKEVPASITIEVNNLVGGAATSNLHDKVAVFRLDGAGGNINKIEYDCVGGEAVGANTITTDAITQDTPGKTTGGVLILVDASDSGAEYRLKYSSWTGSVFTLNEITGTSTGGSTTTLIDTGATFQDGADQVFRGDLIVVTGKGTAHVKTVDSQTQLTIEGTWTAPTTDAYEINTSPVLIDTADKVYVPFIDEVATGATASVSVVYGSQIFYRAKVRNTRATIKIKPFSVDGTTTGSDVTVATIRTTDTIIT